jgi:glycosyl transferase family 87
MRSMRISLTNSQRRAIRHGGVLAGLIVAAWMYLVVGGRTMPSLAADGLVYWGVDVSDPYAGATVGGTNAYLYSPAFAQVFAVIGLLPREVFMVAWTAFLAAVALWLARPWPASLLVLALPVSQEILIGNIHLLLAAAIVLGFRWAGTWAFVLLTKITPGIGLVWFAARREWRSLAMALLVTAAIVVVSFALSPDAWRDWLALLRHDGGSQSIGVLPRVVVAALVVAWGARTDRAWTVPLAAMLALPVIWSDSFSMLLGCVALSRWSQTATEPARQPAGATADATA